MAVDLNEKDAVKKRFVYANPVSDRPMDMERGNIRDNIFSLWRKVRFIFDNIGSVIDLIFENATDIQTVQSEVTNIDNSVTNITNNAAVENRFFGFNPTGGVNLTSGYSDLTITTEVRKDTPFIHSAASAEVEVDESDNYEIFTDAGFNLGAGEVTIEISLWRDTGGGHNLIAGSVAYCGA